jgi:hypothetical protein
MVAGALALTALLTACNHLAFVADHRLHFVTPASRAVVTTPVTLSWTVTGFDGGSFAIFVDRAPIKPGQTVGAVAGGDASCRHTPGCPDAQYLADRQVYTTAKTTLTIDQIPALRGKGTQTHEATIVLLDPSGHRVGEAAWYRDFRIKKR